LLKEHLEVCGDGETVKHLDYGGYNGFLPYAFSQLFAVESTIADLDPRGLKMAKNLGFKIVDLSSAASLPASRFDLITCVHVLEHLEEPARIVKDLHASMQDNAILYAEVPNLYGSPLSDPAHLVAFSRRGLDYLFSKNGFEIVAQGYCSTPLESVDYGYLLSTNTENLYLIARQMPRLHTVKVAAESVERVSISDFLYDLNVTYTRLSLMVGLRILFLFSKRAAYATVLTVASLIDLVALLLRPNISPMTFVANTIRTLRTRRR
jgi:SAM-dependent methyltransferase